MHGLRYFYLPPSFENIIELKSNVQLRNEIGNFEIPVNNTGFLFPLFNAARDWNSLPGTF